MGSRVLFRVFLLQSYKWMRWVWDENLCGAKNDIGDVGSTADFADSADF